MSIEEELELRDLMKKSGKSLGNLSSSELDVFKKLLEKKLEEIKKSGTE